MCEAHEGGEEKEEEEEEEKEEEEEEEGEKREDEEEKKTNDLEKISNLAWLKDSVSLDIGRSKLPFQLATAEEFKGECLLSPHQLKFHDFIDSCHPLTLVIADLLEISRRWFKGSC